MRLIRLTPADRPSTADVRFNPHLIAVVEPSEDDGTWLGLASGDTIEVREPVELVIARIEAAG